MTEDPCFFIYLVQLGLPLYCEDKFGNMAPFIITKVKSDSVFLEAFSALIKAGYNLAALSSRNESFIQRIYQSKHVTVPKMEAILKTNP